MFETPIPVTEDECGAIFIDRDSKNFRLILNFMRDGHVDLQKYSEYLKEIQKEAEYYLLGGLVELCKKSQKSVELEYPNKLRFIKSDEELFEVIYRPEKPVLVLFGPILSERYVKYPGDLDMLDFQRKHASEIEVYISLRPFSDYTRSWYYRVCTKEKSYGNDFSERGSFTEQLEVAMRIVLRN